ncbi:MAG: tetratricopeptide repeat protein, partial [Planctomycetales bacterium]|nr:tetratricopeptide repeat protein [Planctomycetales bacterium]
TGQYRESITAFSVACAQYRALADAARDDTRSELIAQSALAAQNAGVASARLGRYRDAQSLYEVALSQQLQLCAASPQDGQRCHDLGVTYLNLGRLQAQIGLLSAAAVTLATGEASLEQAVAIDPLNARYLRSLAATANAMAEIADLPLEKRLQAINATIDSYEHWTANGAANRDARHILSLAYNSLGALTCQSEDVDVNAAKAAYQQAIAIQDSLCAEAADNVQFLIERATTRNNLARCLLALNQHDAAEAIFRTALRELSSLTLDNQNDALRSSRSGGVLHNLAICLQQQGRTAEAIECLTSAIDHQHDARSKAPEVPLYGRLIAEHQAELARLQNVIATPELRPALQSAEEIRR